MNRESKRNWGYLIIFLTILILYVVTVGIFSFGDSIVTTLFLFPILFLINKNIVRPNRVLIILISIMSFNMFQMFNSDIKNQDGGYSELNYLSGFIIENSLKFFVINKNDLKGINEVYKRVHFMDNFEGDTHIFRVSPDYGPSYKKKRDLNKISYQQKMNDIKKEFTIGGIIFGVLLFFIFIFDESKISSNIIQNNSKVLHKVLWICSLIVYSWTLYVLYPIIF